MAIVDSLRENIIADAFEKRHLTDGVLAERLIRERGNAADLIEKLTEALEPFCVDDPAWSEAPDSLEIELRGVDGQPQPCVTLGQIRRARAALELAKKA